MEKKNCIKKGDKKGQFYLVATIIIIGLMIGLAVIFNYSTKTNSYETEEIAKELSIESEKVIDYDTIHSTNELENFARDYSSYVGSDKGIYFITVNGENKEAYKFNSEGGKIDFTSDLSVIGEGIQFNLNGETYNFKLEEGINFYFIIVYDMGGERYVFAG